MSLPARGDVVDVLNTDAEGRLVLGDGLWYAQKLGATHLVDVATLTGPASWRSDGRPRAVRPARRFVDVVRRTATARRRPLLAAPALRRIPESNQERNRRHGECRRPPGVGVHGRDVHQGIRRRHARAHLESPAPRGQTTPSRTSRRGPPGSLSAGWPRSRSRAATGSRNLEPPRGV